MTMGMLDLMFMLCSVLLSCILLCNSLTSPSLHNACSYKKDMRGMFCFKSNTGR